METIHRTPLQKHKFLSPMVTGLTSEITNQTLVKKQNFPNAACHITRYKVQCMQENKFNQAYLN